MPIYVSVNGEAKLVTEAYIGNKNNQAVPLYLKNTIPKNFSPVDFVYSTVNYSNGFIDTGIIPTVYTKMIVVFSANKGNAGTGNNFWIIKGPSDFGIEIMYHNNYYQPRLKCGSVTATLSTDQISYCNLNSAFSSSTSCTLILNKNTNKTSYGKVNKNSNYTNLGSNTNSNFSSNTNIKFLIQSHCPIKYFAIYKNLITNLTPTREYLPCIERNSATPGFYETVTGTFYCDNTNYKLAAGPVIDDYILPSFD